MRPDTGWLAIDFLILWFLERGTPPFPKIGTSDFHPSFLGSDGLRWRHELIRILARIPCQRPHGENVLEVAVVDHAVLVEHAGDALSLLWDIYEMSVG